MSGVGVTLEEGEAGEFGTVETVEAGEVITLIAAGGDSGKESGSKPSTFLITAPGEDDVEDGVVDSLLVYEYSTR